jgi:hypothetical protein
MGSTQTAGRQVAEYPRPSRGEQIVARSRAHLDASVRDLLLPPPGCSGARALVLVAEEEQGLRIDPRNLDSFAHRNCEQHEPLDLGMLGRNAQRVPPVVRPTGDANYSEPPFGEELQFAPSGLGGIWVARRQEDDLPHGPTGYAARAGRYSHGVCLDPAMGAIDRLEEAARLCESAADELDLAARHARTAAAHYRDKEVPRGAAHAWAAHGHLRAAEEALASQARAHARHSVP